MRWKLQRVMWRRRKKTENNPCTLFRNFLVLLFDFRMEGMEGRELYSLHLSSPPHPFHPSANCRLPSPCTRLMSHFSQLYTVNE